MIKLIVLSVSILVSSIASAHTLNMRPMVVTSNVETVNMESVTIVGHAKRHTLTFAPVIVKVKVQATHVQRAFASASYSAPCEWFARLDGTSVKVCNGSVTMISDGNVTRSVNN